MRRTIHQPRSPILLFRQLIVLLRLPGCALILLRWSNLSRLHLPRAGLGSTQIEVGSSPGALESHTRMWYGQCDASNHNHRSFKNHESDLLIGKLSLEALGELSDTEAATGKDREC